MSAHPYFGMHAALLTLHYKELVIAPVMKEHLNVNVRTVRDFDTDTLGTFSREVPRFGTQLQAAKKKAQLAIEHSSLPLGIGSEGSFTPGPLGLGGWNLELIFFFDAERQLEVVGRAYAPARHLHATIQSESELQDFALRAGFPEYGLLLRPDDEGDARIQKDASNWDTLYSAFSRCLEVSASKKVFVEQDLRAHQHPERMENIRKAALDLSTRLRCVCQACGFPGFGVVEVEKGLPCEACDAPTQQAAFEWHACVKCEFREKRPAPGPRTASARFCSLCNP